MAYLLIHGELPSKEQYDSWVHEITFHTFVHENVKGFMQGFRYDAHPHGGDADASVGGALSTFYPESSKIADPDNRHIQIVRMIAKMPTSAPGPSATRRASRTSTRTTSSPTPRTSSRCSSR